MQVEGTLRYAMSSDIAPPSPPNNSSPPLSVECLHIKDILLDMLEDVQDNVERIGSLHERGAKVRVDAKDVSDGVGLLNQAISVKSHDGDRVHQMNSLFEESV